MSTVEEIMAAIDQLSPREHGYLFSVGRESGRAEARPSEGTRRGGSIAKHAQRVTAPQEADPSAPLNPLPEDERATLE